MLKYDQTKFAPGTDVKFVIVCMYDMRDKLGYVHIPSGLMFADPSFATVFNEPEEARLAADECAEGEENRKFFAVPVKIGWIQIAPENERIQHRVNAAGNYERYIKDVLGREITA